MRLTDLLTINHIKIPVESTQRDKVIKELVDQVPDQVNDIQQAYDAVMEREKIEYRHSDSPDFSKIIMPGMMKHSNITLKRGTFAQDTDYNTWYRTINVNAIRKIIVARM